MNSDTRNILLGSLIGIGRAAESSAHLIDRSLDVYILKALAACGDSSVSDEDGLEMARALNETKAYLVPDCSNCGMPCGKNDDFDMSLIQEEMEPIILLKEQITELLISKATKLVEPMESGESLLLFPFYRGLFSIGARDWSEEDLQGVIEEIGAL